MVIIDNREEIACALLNSAITDDLDKYGHFRYYKKAVLSQR